MDKDSRPLQTRHWLLGGGLALTLAATMWAAQSDPEDAAAAQPVAGERRAAPPSMATGRPAPRGAAGADLAAAATDWRPVRRPAWAEVTPAQLAAWAPPPPPPPRRRHPRRRRRPQRRRRRPFPIN